MAITPEELRLLIKGVNSVCVGAHYIEAIAYTIENLQSHIEGLWSALHLYELKRLRQSDTRVLSPNNDGYDLEHFAIWSLLGLIEPSTFVDPNDGRTRGCYRFTTDALIWLSR